MTGSQLARLADELMADIDIVAYDPEAGRDFETTERI